MLLSSAAFVAVFVGNSVALAAAIAASASIVRHRDGGGHAELDAVDSLHRILASERRVATRGLVSDQGRPEGSHVAISIASRGHGIIIVVVSVVAPSLRGEEVARAAEARAEKHQPNRDHRDHRR